MYFLCINAPFRLAMTYDATSNKAVVGPLLLVSNA